MRFVSKDFLSMSPDESGSIVCSISTIRVKDMSPYTAAKGGTISGSMSISDCSETICLDFYAEGQRSYEKRVEKFDTLLAKIQNMRDQYVEMWESHVRDVVHYNSQKGKEK